ncbi:MAG: VapC toxin family PIN domain ribonuclease [Deltaproteobacteria bacterium HGW-Deltaproteobacteria-10]|nr:MAG: VapC toxin family PIN domain ribonuclease [Deltaproteobacteria bacterium HGW-Deltaproteobacteria-10]
MVLVDTSVWISHLRYGNTDLATLLNNGWVLCHPLIVGELACGNLKDRADILSFLQLLPMSIEAEHEEVLSFIENSSLMGKGIGYVDAHLIASAVLTGISIWTLDKKLAQVAESLHIKYGK